MSWGDGKFPMRPRYKYEDLTKNNYLQIIQAKTRLDEMIYTSLLEYLNDEELCNNEENMFPRYSRLTGNYYVSDEYYSLKNDGVYGSIFTRFTEVIHLPNAKSIEQDYLGLEVWFFIHKCGKIEIYGIDSSSI